MKDEVKAVDEFLGDLNETQEDPFKPEEKDPFNSEEPKVVEETEEKAEKPIPFHKDPKVLRFIEKEVEKRASQFKPSETRQFIEETKGEEDDLVTAFEHIIGNDTPEKQHALNMLRKGITDVGEKATAQVIQKLQQEREQETEAERQAEEELTQGFENIEESYGVDLTSNTPAAKKTKSDFIEFITRIAPKNSEGQVIAFPDLEASFETFQEKRKAPAPTNNRAKELASRSMTRSAESSAPSGKAVNWDTVDKLFDRNN